MRALFFCVCVGAKCVLCHHSYKVFVCLSRVCLFDEVCYVICPRAGEHDFVQFSLWNRFKGAHLRAKFEEFIYTCNVGRGWAALDQEDAEAPQGGGDPDMPGEQDDDHADNMFSQCSMDIKLMLEFLSASIALYDFISIATPDSTDQKFKVFQVLTKGTRNVLAKTYKSDAVIPVQLQWTVQPIEVWRGDDYEEVPSQCDCFIVGDPFDINIVGETGSSPEARQSVVVWDMCDSDLSDCFCLRNLGCVHPKCSLGDPKVPVLSLVDALNAAEYIEQSRLVVHSPTSGLYYDSRNLYSKRTYLQAVLDAPKLWGKGVVSFRSDASVAFYLLLMKSPGPVGRMSAKACQGMLKQLDPSLEQSLNTALVPIPFLLPAPPVNLALMDQEIDGDDGHDVAAPPVASSSSSSSSSSSAPSCIDGEDDLDEAFPEFIEGCPVRVEMHAGRQDVGLRVKCSVHGEGCDMYRSSKLLVPTFGKLAAVHFLGTWLRCGTLERFPNREAHRGWKPKVSDIRQYIRDREREQDG
jgi:hypothetical protein